MEGKVGEMSTEQACYSDPTQRTEVVGSTTSAANHGQAPTSAMLQRNPSHPLAGQQPGITRPWEAGDKTTLLPKPPSNLPRVNHSLQIVIIISPFHPDDRDSATMHFTHLIRTGSLYSQWREISIFKEQLIPPRSQNNL